MKFFKHIIIIEYIPDYEITTNLASSETLFEENSKSLLLNNEFRNETNLTSFQLFGASNGLISIQVKKILF